MSLYSKVLATKRTLIPLNILSQEEDILQIQTKLSQKIRTLFQGSLAIRAVDAGSSNAEEQELTALSNTFYDCDRFGIHFVASPRHADMLLVTGPVSRNMALALKKTYEATPDPKIVVAVGDGAIDGGIFKGSYAIIGGVHEVIPVHFQIPGDPPSPKVILASILHILEALEEKGRTVLLQVFFVSLLVCLGLVHFCLLHWGSIKKLLIIPATFLLLWHLCWELFLVRHYFLAMVCILLLYRQIFLFLLFPCDLII